jgi:LysM repeat protein
MRKVWLSIYFGFSVVFLNAQTRIHTVKTGESLYSIARTYSVTVNDLIKANPELSGNTGVKIGQKLSIPNTGTTTSTTKVAAKVHTVTKGETVYALCKKYGITLAEMKQWNKLTDLNVKVGQKLIVSKANSDAIYKPVAVPSTPDTPYREEDARPRNENLKANAIIEQQQVYEKPKDMPVAEAKPALAPVTTLRTNSSNSLEYPGIFNQYSVSGFKIKKNRGAANYISDNTSGNQFLAFYNDAETGSIIRVTNLMNKKTIFVKVMGKVPPADAAQEIILKLSNKAAQELGAVDEKFLVEVAAYTAVQ